MDTNKLRAWFFLSRSPFHTVGVLPFILGGLLAWYNTGHLNWIILGWGTLAVVLIMLVTYYLGEYFDYETDTLSARLEKNKFSGGISDTTKRNYSQKTGSCCIFCLAFACRRNRIFASVLL